LATYTKEEKKEKKKKKKKKKKHFRGIADRHRQGFRLQNKPTSKHKNADLSNQNS
jgi:hypothetical protein